MPQPVYLSRLLIAWDDRKRATLGLGPGALQLGRIRKHDRARLGSAQPTENNSARGESMKSFKAGLTRAYFDILCRRILANGRPEAADTKSKNYCQDSDLKARKLSLRAVAIISPSTVSRQLLFSPKSRFASDGTVRPVLHRSTVFYSVAVIEETGGLHETGSRIIEESPQGSVARTLGRCAETAIHT